MGPPQQEPSNSVTRRYADRLDGIIRVMFTDEEDRLFVGSRFAQLTVGAGLYQTMRSRETRSRYHGSGPTRPSTRHNDRRRAILASRIFCISAKVSLLCTALIRDHAIWFINNRIIDGVALREWMGSVEETIVAKHSARMGLVSLVRTS
jgi:RNA-dependent RNA polymerase